jgi:hypothetical protein
VQTSQTQRPYYGSTQDDQPLPTTHGSYIIWVVALIVMIIVSLIAWELGILDIRGGHLPLG